MKLSISKDIFLKGLQMVQSVVNIHSPTPILYNVLLTADKKNLYLTVTDLNIYMRCTLDADIKKTGSTTISARRLFNIIRELPNENIDIEVDDKHTTFIQCGSSSYKIFGISPEEFPKIPTFDESKDLSQDQGTFKEMLKQIIYAVSTDESRQVLNGILLSCNNQKLTAVATDGRRLALIEQEVEVPFDSRTDVVIPAKTVNELIKTLNDEGALKIRIHPKMISFENENTMIISKLAEGNYPNYQQVIPNQYEERLTIERESLLSALRRVSLLTSEKFPSIQITLTKNQIKISATTPDIGEAHETVPVKYSGKQIKAAFNPAFFIEPLYNLTCDEVFIEFVDDMSPAVIKCDIPFLYVLMPLRMNE